MPPPEPRSRTRSPSMQFGDRDRVAAAQAREHGRVGQLVALERAVQVRRRWSPARREQRASGGRLECRVGVVDSGLSRGSSRWSCAAPRDVRVAVLILDYIDICQYSSRDETDQTDPDALLLQGAADPTRLAILRQLAAATRSARATSRRAATSPSRPSVHHLKVLRDVGLGRRPSAAPPGSSIASARGGRALPDDRWRIRTIRSAADAAQAAGPPAAGLRSDVVSLAGRVSRSCGLTWCSTAATTRRGDAAAHPLRRCVRAIRGRRDLTRGRASGRHERE